MSKTIGIKGTYHNGVTVQRGLHCKKNYDMVDTGLFIEKEIYLLIKRFYQEVGTKCLNGKVVVTLHKSGSKYEMMRSMQIHVTLLDLYLYSNTFAHFFI